MQYPTLKCRREKLFEKYPGDLEMVCFLLFARVEASIVISVLSFAAITKPTDSTDECSSSPCQNGGTCVNRYNDYLCICADGYSGKSCQTGGLC